MTNAVEHRRPAIIDQLEQSIGELQRLGIDPDRFARTVATEIRKNPDLGKCDPATVLGAVFTCAQLDLEPGPGGYAWLVPFKKKCTFILGYRGMVELARRVGVTVTVGSVYPGDQYHETGGTDPDAVHVHGPQHGEGEPVRWYAVAHLPNGVKVVRSLTREQVEHRRNSGNSANSPAWTGHYDAMARKSSIRALWATLPMGMSTSMRLAESAEHEPPTIARVARHDDQDGPQQQSGDVEVIETGPDDEPDTGHLPAEFVLEVEQLRPDAALTDDAAWTAWLADVTDGGTDTLEGLDPDHCDQVLTVLREKAAG